MGLEGECSRALLILSLGPSLSQFKFYLIRNASVAFVVYFQNSVLGTRDFSASWDFS